MPSWDHFDKWDIGVDIKKAKSQKAQAPKVPKKVYGIAAQVGLKKTNIPDKSNGNVSSLNIERNNTKRQNVKTDHTTKNDILPKIKKQKAKTDPVPAKLKRTISSVSNESEIKRKKPKELVSHRSQSSAELTIREQLILDKNRTNDNSVEKLHRVAQWVHSSKFNQKDEIDSLSEDTTVVPKHLKMKRLSNDFTEPKKKKKISNNINTAFNVNDTNKLPKINNTDVLVGKNGLSSRKNINNEKDKLIDDISKTDAGVDVDGNNADHSSQESNGVSPKQSKKIRPASFVLKITGVSASTQTEIASEMFHDNLLKDDTPDKEKPKTQTKFKIGLENDEFITKVYKTLYDKRGVDLSPLLMSIVDKYVPKVCSNSGVEEDNVFITLSSRFKVMHTKNMDHLELLPEIQSTDTGEPIRIFTFINKEYYEKVLEQPYYKSLPDLLVTRLCKK